MGNRIAIETVELVAGKRYTAMVDADGGEAVDNIGLPPEPSQTVAQRAVASTDTIRSQGNDVPAGNGV
jgi:hypothetical protein